MFSMFEEQAMEDDASAVISNAPGSFSNASLFRERFTSLAYVTLGVAVTVLALVSSSLVL